VRSFGCVGLYVASATSRMVGLLCHSTQRVVGVVAIMVVWLSPPSAWQVEGTESSSLLGCSLVWC
jgi:hypothetical protein